MNTKKIIAIEGLDGVGKSTQVEKLAKAFKKIKEPNRVYKFPNKEDSTYIKIKEYLKNKENPIKLAELYCENRMRSAPWDSIEDTLIFDRSVFSTLQYQLADVSDLESFNDYYQYIYYYDREYIPTADLTIYLDLPFEQITKRIEIRGNADVIESDKEFLYKVYKNLERLKDYPNLVIINCDGLDEEQIHRKIVEVVKEKIIKVYSRGNKQDVFGL